MAISGVGSSYGNVYGSTYTAQKNEAVKKTETKEAAPAQAKNKALLLRSARIYCKGRS